MVKKVYPIAGNYDDGEYNDGCGDCVLMMVALINSYHDFAMQLACVIHLEVFGLYVEDIDGWPYNACWHYHWYFHYHYLLISYFNGFLLPSMTFI